MEQSHIGPVDVQSLSRALTRFGRLYNDYKIEGLENIPRTGPRLLVFYHGLMPIDLWMFGLTLKTSTDLNPVALVDDFLLRVPVLKDICQKIEAVPGRPVVATEYLKQGRLVGVSPGGVREAISGASMDYKLCWSNRMGFAKIAFDTKATLIPCFTENIESAYRAPFSDKKLFKYLYESTRLPLVPIMGLGPLPFPVKLTTWGGEPIPASSCKDHLDVFERTKASLQDLIDEHQTPQPWYRPIFERLSN